MYSPASLYQKDGQPHTEREKFEIQKWADQLDLLSNNLNKNIQVRKKMSCNERK